MEKMLFIYTKLLILFSAYSQNYSQNGPVQFSFSYPNRTDSNWVQLTIDNKTDSAIYYSVGIDGLSDTGWVHLLSNLDALGKNEWFGLKTLSPHQFEKEQISKERVYYIYRYVKPQKIRFYLLYSNRRSSHGIQKVLFVYP